MSSVQGLQAVMTNEVPINQIMFNVLDRRESLIH